MKTIQIRQGKVQRKIGETEPTFIVAEAACNHMCDIDLAKKMIEEAAEAGADAVKFQTYTAEKLVTGKAVAFWGNEKISQLEYYKRLDRFQKVDYATLFQYAQEKKIICFSSPFDSENVQMLAELDMSVYKIASCDIPNTQLIDLIASIRKPIILSTGASTINEIDRAINSVIKYHSDLILLACTLSYPTKASAANFQRIQTLKKHFPDYIVGISDHTEPDENMVIPSVAVALGAKVVEKHYTLDRSMTGSGHFFAVSPMDLSKMVQNIRVAESVIGNGELGVAESEKAAWESARRSIVSAKKIKKGDIITRDMLGLKRPANGLPPEFMEKIIGKFALIDISEDEFLAMKMFDGE